MFQNQPEAVDETHPISPFRWFEAGAPAISRRTALAGLCLAATGGWMPGGAAAQEPGAQAFAPTPTPRPQVAPANVEVRTASIQPDVMRFGRISDLQRIYGQMTDEGRALPAIPVSELQSKHLRRLVTDPTGEEPGTIVVHLKQRQLYLVQNNGDAIRYGVSIGKQGYAWSGRAVVEYARKWPTWRPPAAMLVRKPQLAKFREGFPGGLENPLGARALYIFKDGEDTLFRIHGTPEWRSIGKAASSGCVRMINQDVIDLYNRIEAAKKRTPIVVVA